MFPGIVIFPVALTLPCTCVFVLNSTVPAPLGLSTMLELLKLLILLSLNSKFSVRNLPVLIIPWEFKIILPTTLEAPVVSNLMLPPVSRSA